MPTIPPDSPPNSPSVSATGPADGRLIMGATDVDRVLRRIAHQVIESRRGIDNLTLVGIRTGGDPLAHQLAAILEAIEGTQPPLGHLDITLYRDDLGGQREQPVVKATHLPVDITGRDVLLVDDVLFTGRTIRAALNALMDFGRPSHVMLAVLIDRGHRELPIRPDMVGKNIPTERDDRVTVEISPDNQVTAVYLHGPATP